MLSVCFGGKTAAVLMVVNAVRSGWEKVINWELNTAKGVTGLGGGMVAGFLRNTKIINGNKPLYVTY